MSGRGGKGVDNCDRNSILWMVDLMPGSNRQFNQVPTNRGPRYGILGSDRCWGFWHGPPGPNKISADRICVYSVLRICVCVYTYILVEMKIRINYSMGPKAWWSDLYLCVNRSLVLIRKTDFLPARGEITVLRFSKNWGNNLIGEDMCAYIYAVTREIEHVLFNLILMKVCANMIKAFFFFIRKYFWESWSYFNTSYPHILNAILPGNFLKIIILI